MITMYSVTREQMAELDRRATSEFGVLSILLMENAGRGIADLVCALINKEQRGTVPSKRGQPLFTVVCGPGNNGGDGFVIARHLWNRNYPVEILFAGDLNKVKGDAAVNLAIVRKTEIPLRSLGPDPLKWGQALINSDFIIDAIFGTGFTRTLDGIFLEAVRAINAANKTVLAVDVPTGLDANTGEPRPEAVKAKWTATLGLMKNGLGCESAAQYTGQVIVVDIGLPKELTLYGLPQGPHS